MAEREKYALYNKDTAISDAQGLNLATKGRDKYFSKAQWDRLSLEQKQFVLDSLATMLAGTNPPGLAGIRAIREKMGLPVAPSNVLEGSRNINNVEGW